MIGQSFAPLGDPSQQRPSPNGGESGPQQAIKVLNLRLPHVVGAGAPAPQALLQGMGSAGLPQGQSNPMIQAILQAVLGHFSPQQQAAPSAMGGVGIGSGPGPAPPLPTPAVHYAPSPGGTAGPNPYQRERQIPVPQRDRRAGSV